MSAPPNGHEPSVKRRCREIAPHARPADAVALGVKDASRQLGVTKAIIYKLAWLGALEMTENTVGRGRYRFHLSPGDTLLSLYGRWSSRVLLWNYRTAHRHRQIRESCAVEYAHPYPPGLDQFACQRFVRIGRSSQREVALFYSDAKGSTAHRERLQRDMAAGKWLPAGRPELRPVEPRLAALAIPSLAGLPGTSLDPQTDEAGEPSAANVGRALALTHFNGCATMFAFVAASSGRTEDALRVYVRSFGRVEERMAMLGFTQPTGSAIETTLLSMLAEARQGEKGCAALQEAVETFRSAVRYLERYVRLVDSDGERGLAQLLPHRVPNPRKVWDAGVRANAVVTRRGSARRKKRANRAADRLEAHSRAVRFQLEQLTAVREDALRAIEELDKHSVWRDSLPEEVSRRTPAFVEFLVETTVLDARGDIVPGASQILVFWAWRARDAWLSMEPGALRRQRGMGKKRRSGESTLRDLSRVDAALWNAIAQMKAAPEKGCEAVFEFRGCLPEVGAVTCEPRFITMSRRSVLMGAVFVDPRKQRQRHRLMENWHLRQIGTNAEGLLTTRRDDISLSRWMGSRNRTLVPLDPGYFAARLGALAFDLLTETLGRISEVAQVEQDPARWIEDDAPGFETIAFLASTKAARGEPIREAARMLVSQELFVDAMEVADEVAVANGHEDTWLPALPPLSGIPKEKVPGTLDELRSANPRPVIFQWAGRPLHLHEIGDLVTWLLANRGIVTPHILRHASANRLREMGVSERAIQIIMRHRSPKTTAGYTGRSPTQVRHAQAIARRNGRLVVAHAHARLATRAT